MATASDFKYRPSALTIILTLLLTTLSLPGWAAVIEGRVVMGDAPLSAVSVCAWRSFDQKEPTACASKTDGDGEYRLELPAGEYQLAGYDDKGSLFAYSGRTHISLESSTTLWLGLQAVPKTVPSVESYDDEWSGGLTGALLHQDNPVTGAYIYLYHTDDSTLKGQGYRISLPTDKDGGFYLEDLPADDYLVVARKRQAGGKVGPVVAGDLVAFHPGWVVTVEEGKEISVTLHGIIKSEELSEVASAGQPVVSGIVTDEQGKPVEGVHLFAYTDRVIGHQQPAALSKRTDADGGFELILPKSGTYYIGARQYYGDSPEPGELFGLFEGSVDHGMVLTSGEQRDGITIVVAPVEIQ